MAWTISNPVSVGLATKKSHYDNVWDNSDYLIDYIKGDNGEGSGATGHDHDGTDSLLIRVSATDKVLGRVTAGAGTVEEISCTAAGRAILDDADAAAQRTTLGLGALAVKTTVAEADIDPLSIVQGKLDTALQEVSVEVAANTYATTAALSSTGSYGFVAQVKGGATDLDFEGYSTIALTTSYVTPGLRFKNNNASASIVGWGQARYITTSAKDHWLFLLVRKADGHIIKASSAPDHPSHFFGVDENTFPHPYTEYLEKPLPSDLEIVLVDIDDTKKLIKNKGNNEGILTMLYYDGYRVDMSKESSWKPRDMDGKKTLAEKSDKYSLRKLKI